MRKSKTTFKSPKPSSLLSLPNEKSEKSADILQMITTIRCSTIEHEFILKNENLLRHSWGRPVQMISTYTNEINIFTFISTCFCQLSPKIAAHSSLCLEKSHALYLIELYSFNFWVLGGPMGSQGYIRDLLNCTRFN